MRESGALGGATVRRVHGWMFGAAPPERIAVLRVLTGAFATIYLLVRMHAFLALRSRAAADFAPVGVLSWMSAPFAAGTWVVIVVATVVAGVAFTVGAGFRATGPLFATALLVVTTYRSSWGQVLHFENLLVLHVLIVGWSRSADVWAIRASRRHRPRRGRTDADPYGWPVRLAAIVTVTTYCIAGIAKLRYGGLGWATGETLRNHIAFSAARLDLLGGTPSPLAAPVLRHEWLLPPVAAGTVVLELGAPLALFGRRLRDGWVLGMWALHAGIAGVMFVVFPYPLALVAFAPLFDLERLGATVRRSPARAAASTAPPVTSAPPG